MFLPATLRVANNWGLDASGQQLDPIAWWLQPLDTIWIQQLDTIWKKLSKWIICQKQKHWNHHLDCMFQWFSVTMPPDPMPPELYSLWSPPAPLLARPSHPPYHSWLRRKRSCEVQKTGLTAPQNTEISSKTIDKQFCGKDGWWAKTISHETLEFLLKLFFERTFRSKVEMERWVPSSRMGICTYNYFKTLHVTQPRLGVICRSCRGRALQISKGCTAEKRQDPGPPRPQQIWRSGTFFFADFWSSVLGNPWVCWRSFERHLNKQRKQPIENV